MSEASRESYDAIARFYEMETGADVDDIPFFLNLAARAGGPVLDAGAGTGRVALPLAQAGHQVVGLEFSGAMLSLARRKAATAQARGLRLVQADMCSFEMADRFALVLLAANAFADLEGRDEQERALARFHQHLLPGGILALVLQNPYQWALDPSQEELVFGWEKEGPGPGEKTRMCYAARSDRVAQTRFLRLWYDVAAPDGDLRRYSAAVTLRWCFQPELELLLEKMGFRPEQWYGSYDLDPYTEDGPLLIAIASRP